MACKKNSPCSCCRHDPCTCSTDLKSDVPRTKGSTTLEYPVAVEDRKPLPPMSPGVEVKF